MEGSEEVRITPDEVRLIAFIIGALLVGACVKHWRDIQREPPAQSVFPAPAVPTRSDEERGAE